VGEDEDTGRPVLRIAGPNDAVALMKLKQRLDEETSFMLLEPGERDTSAQTLAGHLEDVSRSENSVVIVAGQHGDLAVYGHDPARLVTAVTVMTVVTGRETERLT